MTDAGERPEADRKPGEQSSAPQRRAWHAPVFMLTEIALTEFMSGGDTDPGSFGS